MNSPVSAEVNRLLTGLKRHGAKNNRACRGSVRGRRYSYGSKLMTYSFRVTVEKPYVRLTSVTVHKAKLLVRVLL